MNENLSAQVVASDEYTQKAQELYAILNIEDNSHITIEEISQEYEKCLQLSQRQNINDSIFYAYR